MNNTIRVTDGRVGYKKPPQHTKFKPGQSGNPSGSNGKARTEMGLNSTILAQLLEPIPTTRGKGRRISARRLGIRNLIAKASRGDFKALTDLLRIREEAGPRRLTRWVKVPYAEGCRMNKGKSLDEAFFKEQARLKAQHNKKIRSDDIPLADLIDNELGRREIVPIEEGKTKRVRKMDLIAEHCRIEHGKGNAQMIKLIQKLEPERWRLGAGTKYEIARPTPEELAEQKERKASHRRQLEMLRKEFPNLNLDDWKHP